MKIDSVYSEFYTDSEIRNKQTIFYRKHVAIIGIFDNLETEEDFDIFANLLWVHGAAVTSYVTEQTDIVIEGLKSDDDNNERMINQLKKEGRSPIIIFQEFIEAVIHENKLYDWYNYESRAVHEQDEDAHPNTSTNGNIITIKIDSDLWNYLSGKDDIERFINFCIRERKEVIEKDYRKPMALSEESKAKRKVSLDYHKFAADSDVVNKTTPFYHKNIVITGTFARYPMRDDIAALLHPYGAAFKGSVSSKTDIVIVGSNPGPRKVIEIKEEQASGHLIRVIDEQELYSIFEENNIN